MPINTNELIIEHDNLRIAYVVLELKLAIARQALEEVSLPPYGESDLKSLLETLRVRAKSALSQIDEEKHV